MNMSVFVALLAGLALAYLWLGRRAAKTLNTQEDYYLSNRRVGVWTLSITILATQLGGAAILGAAEEAYHLGWVGLLYAGGIGLGFILLTLGIGAKIRETEVSTLPELFERAFRSPRLRELAAILSVISLFLILIGQGIATQKFFLAIGFTSPWWCLGFWAILIGYTVMGGLKAVIDTDILQAIFIIITFLLVAFWVTPSIMEHWHIIKAAALPSVESVQVPWVSWLLLPMFFMIVGQDMGQRCSAAMTPATVTRATLLAAVIYMAFAVIPVALGVLAVTVPNTMSDNSSVLMHTIIYYTNPIIASMTACALLMAIISTADSLLCAISANVAMDFPWIKNRSNGREVFWAKIITLTLGGLAVVFSFSSDRIIPLLIQAYELSIVTLLIPILLALYRQHWPTVVGWAAVITGGLSYYLLPDNNLKIILSLLLSLLSVVSSLLSYKMLSRKK